MAQGKVSVNNLNLQQGSFPDVERKALFIGIGTKNDGAVLSINTQTDINDALGVNDSEIKRNVVAANANGGENWLCYAMPQTAGYDVNTQIDVAMATVSPEFIVVLTPVADKAAVEALHAKAESLRTSQARRVIVVAATVGIDAGNQTWADYETAQAAFTDDVAAYRVGLVPQLHGNDLGAVIGRLCKHSVSIADSPMRVATGAVLGLGDVPVDSDSVLLPDATLAVLDSHRLSCIQRYVDYPGTYFGDLNLLDVPAGDYQVVENLRVVDKQARRVRILAIAQIANRSFNNTPLSKAANTTYFSRPLREASHSTVISGVHFPGEIQPPEENAVVINWINLTDVEIYITVKPYNSPKDITANILLDLSGA